MAIWDKVTDLFKEDPIEKRKKEEELQRNYALARKLAIANKELLLDKSPNIDLGLYNGTGKNLTTVNGTYDQNSGSFLVDVKARVLFIPVWSSKRYRVIQAESFESLLGRYQFSNYIFISEIVSGSQQNQLLCNDGLYIGVARNGQRCGFGRIQWNEGTIFEGEFRNGKIVGVGTIKFPNQEKYSGEFSEISYTNAYYIGQVDKPLGNDKKKHGRGRLASYNNGCIHVYVGDFFDNRYHGNGILYFSSGDIYSGQFSNGLRTGRGRYIWENGAIHNGQWLAGKRHGQGVQYSVDGNVVCQGVWVNDKFSKYEVVNISTSDTFFSNNKLQINNINSQMSTSHNYTNEETNDMSIDEVLSTFKALESFGSMIAEMLFDIENSSEGTINKSSNSITNFNTFPETLQNIFAIELWYLRFFGLDLALYKTLGDKRIKVMDGIRSYLHNNQNKLTVYKYGVLDDDRISFFREIEELGGSVNFDANALFTNEINDRMENYANLLNKSFEKESDMITAIGAEYSRLVGIKAFKNIGYSLKQTQKEAVVLACREAIAMSDLIDDINDYILNDNS